MSNTESNARTPRFDLGQGVKFRESKSLGGRLAAALVIDVHGVDCFSVMVFPNDSRPPYRATSVSVGNNGHYIES